MLNAVLGAIGCAFSAGAVTPRQLVEVVDFNSPVLSLDGRRVAFRTEQAAIERNTFDTAWFVQDVDGAAPPLRVGDGGFPLHAYYGLSAPESAVWSPDGQWIYYRAMIGGAIDIWRAAVDGSTTEPVTQDAADVRAFTLSADGRILTYSIGATREQVDAAEKAEYERGVRLDKTIPVGQALFRSGHVEGRAMTQRYRGGRELERTGMLADVADRWIAIDLTTGQRREVGSPAVPIAAGKYLPGHNERDEPWKQIAERSGDRIALLTRSGNGEGMYVQPHVELSAQLADGQRAVVCQAAPCRNKMIADTQWRPGSDEVVFTVSDPDEGLAQTLYRWNVITGVVRPIARARGLLNGGRDVHSPCGISARVLVCIAAEADGPPRLERVDLDTGERHVLFEPNAALALDVAANPPARLLRWTDPAGRAFTAHFFPARRTSDRAPPLFINYYLCPGFVRGGTGDEWPMASLARQGIAALCINYAPLPLDAVARYDQGLSAVRSVVELLASAGEIDRTRVGMGGLSFGAEVTLWMLVNSDLLTAASVASPAHTPLTYGLRNLYDDTFLAALERYWQLRSPDETPERWRVLSPAFNWDKVRSPLLMQLPEQEYLQSLDYAVPLIKAGRAELYVFPDEAHFKFMPQHKLAAYERNLDWFRFWLLGFENDDPRKKEQYKHWHAIRESTCMRKGRGRDVRPWYCGKA